MQDKTRNQVALFLVLDCAQNIWLLVTADVLETLLGIVKVYTRGSDVSRSTLTFFSATSAAPKGRRRVHLYSQAVWVCVL